MVSSLLFGFAFPKRDSCWWLVSDGGFASAFGAVGVGLAALCAVFVWVLGLTCCGRGSRLNRGLF